jgi:threonine dehydratase
MNHRLSLDSIAQAMSTIDPVFLNSPQFVCEPLAAALGCELVVKIETLNPIRSFKGRGASHFVACMATTQPLVCASAGNFGQALAYACRARGINLTVYASTNANPLKLERMRALGAHVVLEGADFDAAKLAAKHYAADMGLPMIEDGLQPLLSEGAGTIGIELLRDPKPFDALLVALGNGAMLNGIARWVKANAPHTRIVAVCASGATSMLDSWRAGRVIEHPAINTIADGIGVRVPIPEALDDMQELVDEGLPVSDEQMIAGMKLAYEHLGLLLEPSGAAGLAAIMAHQERFAGQRVASILCGGNLTMEQARKWVEG